MEMMELWLALLSILSGGLGWLTKHTMGRIDELEDKVNCQQVEISVNRNETMGIRSDIAELKGLLRDIDRKLDEHRQKDD
jgi:hypothetical protein